LNNMAIHVWLKNDYHAMTWILRWQVQMILKWLEYEDAVGNSLQND